MALVQLMLPGLAFFYAGLLHRTSVRAPQVARARYARGTVDDARTPRRS